MNEQMAKQLERELREMKSEDLSEVLQAFGLEEYECKTSKKKRK